MRKLAKQAFPAQPDPPGRSPMRVTAASCFCLYISISYIAIVKPTLSSSGAGDKEVQDTRGFYVHAAVRIPVEVTVHTSSTRFKSLSWTSPCSQ